jgi:diphosphomevalonate decarboxylase
VLNLPAAGSLSLTLGGLDTTTTVRFGGAAADTLVIDGAVAGEAALKKAQRVLDLVRAAAGLAGAPVLVESANGFPTGAGLASSASGLAALTVAAARAAGLALTPEELSRIARVGSGSACRSLFGGFVEWTAGVAPDGSDSHARPVAPPEHWDLRVVVAVVEDRPKAVNSTRGMTHTAETSPFHAPFLATVGGDLGAARDAIAARDFAALGRVAERSSLRMHAAMMAADPALVYLRPESWQVVNALRALQADGVQTFFTADAGPNVKAFCTPAAEPAVRAALGALGCVRRLIAARPGPAPELLS